MITRKIKRGLYNWLTDAKSQNKAYESEANVPMVDGSKGKNGPLVSEGIRFNLYNAEGGTIVEVYDSSYATRISNGNGRDRGPKLYIIPESVDLGSEIAKIFTIEKLGRM